MKTKNKIIFITIALSIVLTTYIAVLIIRDIRIYNNQKLWHNNMCFNPGLKFKFNNVYPESLNEFINWSELDSIGLDIFEKEMIDPFLINGETIKYYPLYADTTKNPVACIFLSVGEDGILNNVINSKLHLHNWHVKINAYNLEYVKNEIEKYEVKYPVFNRKNRTTHWHYFYVDSSVIENEMIVLKGDSLFRDTYDFSTINSLSYPQNTFIYPEYSIKNRCFGKKDYIVGWGGYRVIEYEIVKD